MRNFMAFAGMLLLSANLIANEPVKQNCHCKNCKCTKEKHCGCYSGEGCKCSEQDGNSEGKAVCGCLEEKPQAEE